MVGVSKKTKKLIKPRKPEKNNRKNRTAKKNWLNRLEFLKIWLVRFGFGFISLKLEKTNRTQTRKKQNQAEPKKIEPNQKNRAKQKKPSQIRKTSFCSKITEPKPVGLNRFGFCFFFKPVWLLFFYKNRTEPKMITPIL